MFMRFGPVIYIAVSLILTVLGGIIGTRFGWHIDAAWTLIAASAFVFAPEVTLILGLLLGLTLDGLAGAGSILYIFAYGGFAAILAYGRRPFYVEGFFPGWITSIIGAELLWLFIGGYCRAILLFGGTVRVPGWLSPFLVCALVGFPLAYWLAVVFRPRPSEPGPSRLHVRPRSIRT
jgi:hypothetical protein